MDTFGVPYDLGSIMHYGNNYGDPIYLKTIDPDYQKTIGQEDDLSFLDIKTANLVYCNSNFVIHPISPNFNFFLKEYVKIPLLAKETDILTQKHAQNVFAQMALVELFVKI
jgi:hypothetical protein